MSGAVSIPNQNLPISLSRHLSARHAQAALALGVLAWRRPQAFAPSAVAAAVTAPARRASWAGGLANPAGGALTEDGARRLVLDWQRAKAAATGAAHERGALDAVLGGRMLQDWRQRAAELQEDGWRAPKHLTSAEL